MENFLGAYDEMPKEKTSFLDLEFLLKGVKRDSEGSELTISEERERAVKYEELALAFNAGANGEWGYYGPMSTWNDSDGRKIHLPDKSLITKEVLDYWRDRSSKTNNPLLKLRYLGLQIEFRPLIGERASGKERIEYVNAICETIRQDLMDQSIMGFSHLDRALDIAVSTKQDSLINQVKALYFAYDSKYSTDQTPGLYAHLVSALKKYPKAFAEEEKTLIESKLKERFERLLSAEDYHYLTECVNLIVECFVKSDKEYALECLRKLETTTLRLKEKLSAMNAQIHLHRVGKHFYDMAAKADYERVLKEIEELGPEALGSLNPVEIEFGEELQDALKKVYEDLGSGSLNQRLIKFIRAYWHTYSMDKSTADKQKNSMMGLVSTVAYDQNGRPVTFSPVNDTSDKDAIEVFRTFVPCMSQLHHPALLKNIADNVIGKETVMDLIDHCQSFKPANRPIIEKALDAFYNEDYVQFMHIVIPQIEGACRTFVAHSDETVFATKDTSAGYSYVTFEGILRKDCIMALCNGDFSYHMRAVFTDSHGLNLRNEIMHGMAPMAYFTPCYADIVFHSLILTATVMTDKN